MLWVRKDEGHTNARQWTAHYKTQDNTRAQHTCTAQHNTYNTYQNLIGICCQFYFEFPPSTCLKPNFFPLCPFCAALVCWFIICFYVSLSPCYVSVFCCAFNWLSRAKDFEALWKLLVPKKRLSHVFKAQQTSKKRRWKAAAPPPSASALLKKEQTSCRRKYRHMFA